MHPFDSYPQQGRALLGQVKKGNSRHGYCLYFMQITGQTSCAYCGKDFTASYEKWLDISLDHVVPSKVCQHLGVATKWSNDYANTVLACRGCNEFRNRFTSPKVTCPVTIEEFFDLRDRIFVERKAGIDMAHEEERKFFSRRLWEKRG
jgi:hypothetical protein